MSLPTSVSKHIIDLVTKMPRAGIFGRALFHRIYLDLEEWLAMTVALPVAALLLVFDDQDLGRAADLGDGAFDGSFGNEGGANGSVCAIVPEKDFVEDD